MVSIRRPSQYLVAVAALAAGCSSAATSPTPGSISPVPVEHDAKPASIALRAPDGNAAWRTSIARTPTPGEGCFQATAPGTTWQKVPCVDGPPARPHPRSPPRQLATNASSTRTQARDFRALPDLVGGSGRDWMLGLPGSELLTGVVGSFSSELGGSGESDDNGQARNTGNNSYMLQLNTNVFALQNPAPVAACNGSFFCNGWEQLLYDSLAGTIFIEYTLIDYPESCPAPFSNGYPGDSGTNCWFDGPTTSVPTEAASNLANMTLSGAVAGNDETITLTVGSQSYSRTFQSVLGLSAGWNEAEFNIFGDAGGTEASFAGSTSLEVQMIADGTGPARQAPVCFFASETGETNSLDASTGAGGCCAFGGNEIGVQFMESNDGAASPACPRSSPRRAPSRYPSAASRTRRSRPSTAS